MFGHESQPSVMYRYGAWRPVEGLERVEDQMRRAHRYRNALVRNERNRREAVDRLLRELSPRLVEIEGLIADEKARRDLARRAIQEASVEARRCVRPRDLVNRVREATRNLRPMYALRKDLRTGLFQSDAWKDRSVAIEEKYTRRSRRLREASGLYWGNYLHVEQSLSDMRSGAPPQFLRWRGDGHLTVQLQPKGGRGKGAARQKGRLFSVADAFAGTDSRIRIEPMPSEGSRQRRKRTRLWFRIGSDGKAPLWAVLGICLHRPLPDDAHIKWVHLLRRRIAADDRWEVSFALSRATGWGKTDCAADGHVDIDVGWRIRPQSEIRKIRLGRFRKAAAMLERWTKDAAPHVPDWLLRGPKDGPEALSALVARWVTERFPGDGGAFGDLEHWRAEDAMLSEPGPGLRVAYWRGSDGDEDEIVLPPRWLREYLAVYGLQSVRRRHFNAALDRLKEWLKERPVPEWLAERTRGMAAWKSALRLMRVVEAWGTQRFPGDEEIFPLMAEWRRRDLHLWRYEAHRRDRLQTQRQDFFFRYFAARMRRRYHIANIEKLDFRNFHVLPKPEDPPQDEIVRRHTRHACLSSLVDALRNSMAEVVEVDPKHTTMRCIQCGHVEDFDRLKLKKTCPACGHEEDQDRGATINIGRRARAPR